MSRSILGRIRARLAARRARRQRLDAFLQFSALPREMQADLMRPSLFEAFDEVARDGWPNCPFLRMG